MKDLVIVGASGLGKEVAWLAKRMGLTVRGFLDDNTELVGSNFYHKPILGRVEDWCDFSNSQFVIAIASPQVKEKILSKMKAKGQPDFATLIDPSVQINIEDTRIGTGTIICAGSICSAETFIGSHCVVNKLCSIGHDAAIHDFVTLSPQVMLGGHTIVERGAEIGAASLVRQGLVVGAGAILGMGAVVTKSVPAGVVVAGNPAKPLQRL